MTCRVAARPPAGFQVGDRVCARAWGEHGTVIGVMRSAGRLKSYRVRLDGGEEIILLEGAAIMPSIVPEPNPPEAA